MTTMQYEQELLEQIRELPAEEIKEVLDFASFLRQRRQREESRLQEERERAAKRMDERRERIGPVDIRAADLVEEGRVVRTAEILQEGKGA
jgi:hypothetical protein